MKLWVDDLRVPEPDWVWAKTSQEAIDLLQLSFFQSNPAKHYTHMSLDHDLGGDDTTRRVVLWLCRYTPDFWPAIITVHSANPVGVEWLEGMVERYGPGLTR